MDKGTVIKMLEHLPETFSIEELIDKLIFPDKVQHGRKDVEAGRVISLNVVKENIRNE